MRSFRLALLASATVAFAACSDDAVSPAGPTIAGGPQPGLSTLEATTTTASDSVQSGYGTESTGGLEYESFEYDPETGTETVVTDDPDATPAGTTTTTAEPDSVQSGYGSGSTGGLEYDGF